MKRISGLIMLLLLFAAQVSAQRSDTLKYRYVNQSLYRYGSFFIRGNERLSFAQLVHEFDGYPLALTRYLKAKKTRTVSSVFRYGSLLTGIATLALLGQHSGHKNLYYVLLGGQLAIGIGSAWYGNQSARYLDEAIWLRNKDLLFPAR